MLSIILSARSHVVPTCANNLGTTGHNLGSLQEIQLISPQTYDDMRP